MRTIRRVRPFTGKWEGFLEEVTFSLVWSRKGMPGRGNSKRIDVTPPGRQVPKGLAQIQETRLGPAVVSGAPGCLCLHSSGATSKRSDLGQGTSLLSTQFPHL